jgi:uncharacterized SAM-binding protein YcdF (DUF218 family)
MQAIMNNPEKPERQRKSLRRFISWSLCLFVVWTIIAPFLAYILVVEKPVENPDAMWILGGSSAYLERTQKAAEIYRQIKPKKVFVVDDDIRGGWNDAEKRNLPFFEISKRELIANGVDEAAIEIVKPLGDGTNYEADIFASKNTDNHINSLLLITSPYHTRRALWTFEHFNPNINLGIAYPEINDQTPSIYTWQFSAKGRNSVFGEYLKFFYYWLYY